jgi:hypothetical protein
MKWYHKCIHANERDKGHVPWDIEAGNADSEQLDVLGVEDRATSRHLHGELSRELGVQTGGERESVDVNGDDGTRNNSTESDCTLCFDSGVRSEAHVWERWALQGRRCEVHALVDVDGERERLIDVDRVEIVRNLLNLIHNLRHSLLNGILDLGEDVLDLAEEATACE